MPKLKNIPTNIITGFLGAGKTTALNKLLAQKPQDEVWAVLINEFGQIGIDQAALQDSESNINVKELLGGCICCTLGPSLTATLATLLRQSKPDRLIIEPTGIGHPAGILDSLQGDNFKDVLDVRSIICLVDSRSTQDPEIKEHPTFVDQVALADIIILNKTDLATDSQLNFTKTKMQNLFPPKQKVLETINGELDIALLDLTHTEENIENRETFSHLDLNADNSNSSMPGLVMCITPQPGAPLQKGSSGNGMHTMGWVFHQGDKFAVEKLDKLFMELAQNERVKGVFNTDRGWLFYNQVGEELDTSDIAYRRDSRVEVISQQPLDWNNLEQKLKNCLMTSK